VITASSSAGSIGFGTLTRTSTGLGLGLAMVRHIVELHGGTVHAHSAGKDQGATLTVKLPLMPVREPEVTRSETGQRRHPTAYIDEPFDCPAELAGLRILVLEDEPDARQLLTTILSHCKADVFGVESAEEAGKAIKRFQPDIILSDIEMPGEDGYLFMKHLRSADGPSAMIPAAALTAHVSVADRMRALAAGYDIHVPKPIEPAELLAVITSLATRARRRNS